MQLKCSSIHLYVKDLYKKGNFAVQIPVSILGNMDENPLPVCSFDICNYSPLIANTRCGILAHFHMLSPPLP